MSTKTWHWHVDIDTNAAALARFGRALVECEAAVPQIWRGVGGHPLGRGVTALAVVTLREGTERRFCAICRPQRMAAPPRVCVGTSPLPVDDGHPGRPERGWPCELDPWRGMEETA